MGENGKSISEELSEEEKVELLKKQEIEQQKLIEKQKEEEKLEEEKLLKKLDKSRKSWQAYKSIESDLLRILEYIPLETKQYTVFSPKLADIIIRSCTQIESIFKDLIRERTFLEELDGKEYNLLKKRVEEGKSNINDFLKYFEKPLSLKSLIITLKANEESFAPFNIYLERDQKDIPFWWKYYNKLKHHFSKNLELGHLQAAVLALGALFILNCKIPDNQDNLVLNKTIWSPNFVHIGHLLSYVKQKEKQTIYNLVAETPIFHFWLFFNQENMSLTTIPGPMKVGEGTEIS